MIDLLHDEAFLVRACAARALGERGDVQAVEPLIVCIDDSSSVVRTHSAEALGQLGETRATERLRQALHDPDIWVVKTAVWSLGELKAIETLPDLEAALHRSRSALSDDIDTVRHIAGVIERFTGHPHLFGASWL